MVGALLLAHISCTRLMNPVLAVGCREGIAMLLSGELPLAKWSRLPLGVMPVAKDQLPGAQKAGPLLWEAINWGMTYPSEIPAESRLQTTSFLGFSPCPPASLTLLLPSATSINHVNKNPCLRLCFQKLTMLLAALPGPGPTLCL